MYKVGPKHTLLLCGSVFMTHVQYIIIPCVFYISFDKNDRQKYLNLFGLNLIDTIRIAYGQNCIWPKNDNNHKNTSYYILLSGKPAVFVKIIGFGACLCNIILHLCFCMSQLRFWGCWDSLIPIWLFFNITLKDFTKSNGCGSFSHFIKLLVLRSIFSSLKKNTTIHGHFLCWIKPSVLKITEPSWRP